MHYAVKKILCAKGERKMSKEHVEIQLSEDVYKSLEIIGKKYGLTPDDALRVLTTMFLEECKAETEGKYAMFILDYGEKGFIIHMPNDLPKLDPEHKKTKVVTIKMPEYAKYPGMRKP